VNTRANAAALVLLDYGNGYALLREQAVTEADEDRYVLTDQGSRDLAMAQLFDRGRSVADVARDVG
jgi:hypothetical protein